MVTTLQIVLTITAICSLLNVVISSIYVMTIILVKRFHTALNLLTVNVCLSNILTSSYWAMYYISAGFYPLFLLQSTLFCSVIPYFQIMTCCLILYALTTVTINRFFVIVYRNKPFFKSPLWSFISILLQWIIVIILPLPNVIFLFQSCLNFNLAPLWLRAYNLFIVVILPIFVNSLFNLLIFLKVRSSTRRVQAQTNSVSSVTTTNNNQTGRDIQLVKHMLFIFITFIGGWGPSFFLTVVNSGGVLSEYIILVVYLLPNINLLIFIVDLFWYNRDVRNYLKEKLLNCIRLN